MKKKKKIPAAGWRNVSSLYMSSSHKLGSKAKETRSNRNNEGQLLHPSTIAPFSAALKTISATTFLTKSKKFFSSCD
jgi:hypothetical protein